MSRMFPSPGYYTHDYTPCPRFVFGIIVKAIVSPCVSP